MKKIREKKKDERRMKINIKAVVIAAYLEIEEKTAQIK